MNALVRVTTSDDANVAMAWRTDWPVPHVRADSGEVRVRVVCAGGNPADDKLNRGMIPFAGVNKVIGTDVAGVVDEVGARVTGLRVGDRVFGCTGVAVAGAFAEYVVGDEQLFVSMPDSLAFADAAALPLAGHTALDAAEYVRAGATVVVVGASGGVGSLLVQLALARGAARVIAVSSHTALCRELGAHEAINYKTAPGGWANALAGRNCDLVLDCVGGDAVWRDALRVLRPNGDFVTVAGDFDDGLSVLGLVRLLGQAIWRFVAYRVSAAPSFQLLFSSATPDKMRQLSALVSEGKLRAVLDPTSPLPLDQPSAVAMMRRFRAKTTTGKLVFQISNE
jgi:NADPH:quinone reductase-like Zn-dependent oxidoreductase